MPRHKTGTPDTKPRSSSHYGTEFQTTLKQQCEDATLLLASDHWLADAGEERGLHPDEVPAQWGDVDAILDFCVSSCAGAMLIFSVSFLLCIVTCIWI